MTVLREEEPALHFTELPAGASANHRQRRSLRSFIHHTYGHPLAQDISLTERRSQPSGTASQALQPAKRRAAASRAASFVSMPLFFHLLEAVNVLVALGIWDVSLAQAMAAEIAERRVSHDQESEQRGRPASAQQHPHGITRAALAQMLAIEKAALTTLLLKPGGAEELRSYLASPGICGACLNLREPLVACRRDCGRQLCPQCRSVDMQQSLNLRAPAPHIVESSHQVAAGGL